MARVVTGGGNDSSLHKSAPTGAPTGRMQDRSERKPYNSDFGGRRTSSESVLERAQRLVSDIADPTGIRQEVDRQERMRQRAGTSGWAPSEIRGGVFPGQSRREQSQGNRWQAESPKEWVAHRDFLDFLREQGALPEPQQSPAPEAPRVREAGQHLRPDRHPEDSSPTEVPTGMLANQPQGGNWLWGNDQSLLSYHPMLDPRVWIANAAPGPSPQTAGSAGGAASLLDLLPALLGGLA